MHSNQILMQIDAHNPIESGGVEEMKQPPHRFQIFKSKFHYVLMKYSLVFNPTNNINTALEISHRRIDNCSRWFTSRIKNLLFVARVNFFPTICLQVENVEIIHCFVIWSLSSKHIQFVLESKKAKVISKWRTLSYGL